MSLLVFPNGKEWLYQGSVPRGWRVVRIEHLPYEGRKIHLKPWRRQCIANLVGWLMSLIDEPESGLGGSW